MSSSSIPHRGARVLCTSTCPVHHIETGLDRLKPPPAGWPDIRGLNSLNASRNTWLTEAAIETSINTYIRGLPGGLQDMIGDGSFGLNPLIWSQNAQGRDQLARAIASPSRRTIRRLKAKEYYIGGVCCEGNHWVLVILHMNQASNPDDASKKEWSRVVQAAVLDPYRSTSNTEFVHKTLREWMTRAGKFTFAPNYRKTVWVPLQRDGHSCGPRAYWHAKQLLDRLLELHENGVNYDPSLWGDLSGWFNESFVRDEMRGRCAAAAVREMDYNARVAVEIVNKTAEFGEPIKNKSSWKSARDMMRPRDMTGEKPEPRPSGFQVNQMAGSGFGLFGSAAGPSVPGPSSGMGANFGSSSNNNSGPPQGPPYIPPPPIPNQHLVVPGVTPTNQISPPAPADLFNTPGSMSLSPTYPPPLTPNNPIPPSQPGSAAANPIDLTDSPPKNLIKPLSLGPSPGNKYKKPGKPPKKPSVAITGGGLQVGTVASGSGTASAGVTAQGIIAGTTAASSLQGQVPVPAPGPAAPYPPPKSSPNKRLPSDSQYVQRPKKKPKTATLPKGEVKPKVPKGTKKTQPKGTKKTQSKPKPPKGGPKGGPPKGGAGASASAGGKK
ncbi:hypothetical protein F4859DRAFT_267674 [Xylaria cf. heliscus]|nr:hypothetical protein F4859DRAFT_267674 [Xylaria cf. heliscus]